MYENASWKCSLLQKYSGVVSIDDGDLLHGDGRGSSGAGGARSSDDLGGFLGHLGLSGDGGSTGNSGFSSSGGCNGSLSLLSLGSLVVTEAVLDGTSDGITESSVVAILG